MSFRQSFTVAALVALPSLVSSSGVNVYWGQHGSGDLATACEDPSFDFITLGFVNLSPENGGSTGYPGTNFGGHCWAEWYEADGSSSKLLSECPSLTPGIAVCQQLGKKVLLSIGGVYSPIDGSDYTVSSWDNGVAFAEFIWGAFGPRDSEWVALDKPRPFDDGTTYNAVDGYDFDLESSLGTCSLFQIAPLDLLHTNLKSSRRRGIRRDDHQAERPDQRLRAGRYHHCCSPVPP